MACLRSGCSNCLRLRTDFYSARRADPDPLEFLGWAVVFGAAEAAAALMPVAWAYGILTVIVGAAVQLFAVSATVYVQKTAPEAQRGHALSAYNAGFMGFVPAGSFVVAGLAAAAGTRWALIGPGAAIAACGAIALAGTAHGRRHSRIPDPGPGRPGKIALNKTPSERSFHMTACGIAYCPHSAPGSGRKRTGRKPGTPPGPRKTRPGSRFSPRPPFLPPQTTGPAAPTPQCPPPRTARNDPRKPAAGPPGMPKGHLPCTTLAPYAYGRPDS